ncbi:MAG TPA: 4Fe-4S binding protein [Coriobacteriia bacterium]|nr:4Fe-4S binding protein [Coriobacteriia bacterium]
MRTIVFASGKGGTGKTTLTALAAHFAAAGGAPLVLADCDVEAANLPIALRAVETGCDAFAGGAKAVIDPEACRGCGACQVACRFDAIGPSEEYFRDRTYVVDPWACEGCGACVPVCGDAAIRMEPSQAGEVCSADTSVGAMVFGRLAPGEDLSGKLVTEVRTRAARVAEERGASLMLIDGPPGVGCPAIASVTGADLLVAVAEPTISGEHDLRRLVLLARRLGTPVAVVLNKADLSHSGAERIRALAAAEGLPLLGDVPFDPDLAGALERLAMGAEPATAATTGPPAPAVAGQVPDALGDPDRQGTAAVRRIWFSVAEMAAAQGPLGE